MNLARGLNSYYHGYSRLREDGLIFLPVHVLQWIIVALLFLWFWFWFLFISITLICVAYQSTPPIWRFVAFAVFWFGVKIYEWRKR